MKVNKLILILSICVNTFPFVATAQKTFKEYTAYKQIPVTGNGSWDYLSVDTKGRRLYLSHGEKVDVVDVDNDKVIGEITNLTGVHGIAIAGPENKGFIGNAGTSEVIAFDLKTNQEIARIPANGKGLDAVNYNPLLHLIIAHSSKTNNITVIDAKTNEVKGSVESLGKTEFGASDDKGFYYINLEKENEVAKIDLRSLKEVARWSLTPDGTPAGMAIDIKNKRLFSGARTNNLVVLDTETGEIITTVPIGDHNDAIVYDPESKLIYVSGIQADLTIIKQISKDKYEVVQHVKTKFMSKTMAMDMKTKKLYLSSATFDGTDEKKSKMLPDSFEVLVYKN